MTLLDFLAESITQVSFFLLAVFITPRHVKVPKGWGGGKKKAQAVVYATTTACALCFYLSQRSSLCVCVRRLLLDVTVTVHEAVYATSGINELALTGVEWVRSAGDFYLYYRIGLAFELYGVVGLASRTCEEHVAVGHILEYYWTIILWVEVFLHFVCFLCHAGNRRAG